MDPPNLCSIFMCEREKLDSDINFITSKAITATYF